MSHAYDRAEKLGQRLQAGLRELSKKHSVIGNVRGLGFMQAIELVTDQKTKTPLCHSGRFSTLNEPETRRCACVLARADHKDLVRETNSQALVRWQRACSGRFSLSGRRLLGDGLFELVEADLLALGSSRIERDGTGDERQTQEAFPVDSRGHYAKLHKDERLGLKTNGTAKFRPRRRPSGEFFAIGRAAPDESMVKSTS